MRAPWPWIAATVALGAAVAYLLVDNRALARQLAATRAAPAASAPPAAAPAATTPSSGEPAARPRGLAKLAEAFRSAEPVAAEPPKENRMERRARRTAELADLLGRLEGESEADYQARVSPFVAMMLERPRQRVAEMRREIEQKAGVTSEQSAKLDRAFGAVYDEVLEYTNAAISEGQLSPYQRNVSGMLSYVGGLGGILGAAEKEVAGILRPEQVSVLAESGFEWGEFLGVTVPWEKLRAPPPRPAK